MIDIKDKDVQTLNLFHSLNIIKGVLFFILEGLRHHPKAWQKIGLVPSFFMSKRTGKK